MPSTNTSDTTKASKRFQAETEKRKSILALILQEEEEEEQAHEAPVGFAR